MYYPFKESLGDVQVPKWFPQCAAVAVGCGITVSIVHRIWKKASLDKKLNRKQQDLKAKRNELVKQVKHYNLNPDLQKTIVGLSSEALRNRLQSGDLKAIDVLRAYQEEALKVDDKLNCITEPLLEAVDYATACDANQAKKGVLHGMPFSIKENFTIQGYDTTIGMEYFINKPHDVTAVLIQVLIKLGAVPFVRTNVPQTMYSYSCSNPIYGVTKNPHDVKRAPGGSSGGEAALIGGGGSLMGLGGDIGGSLRIPSNMCGICALKPTRQRLSGKGSFSVARGQTLVLGVPGTMARDVDTLAMLQEALLCEEMFHLDSTVAPIPFRTEIYKSTKPLKIGFYTMDGGVQTVPSNVRAVHVATAALERMGHTVVTFEPPRVIEAIATLYLRSVLGDRCRSMSEKLTNDYVDDSFKLLYYMCGLPKCLTWVLSKILYPIDHFLSLALKNCSGVESVYDWFTLALKIEEYKEEFLQSWRSQELDAVIAPIYPCPAVTLNIAAKLTVAGSLSQLYNLLDYPAGALPVTTVTPEDIANLKNPNRYSPRNLQEKTIKRSCEGGEGLPVCVQCIAQPFQEELVLRVMKDVEKGLKIQ